MKVGGGGGWDGGKWWWENGDNCICTTIKSDKKIRTSDREKREAEGDLTYKQENAT